MICWLLVDTSSPKVNVVPPGKGQLVGVIVGIIVLVGTGVEVDVGFCIGVEVGIAIVAGAQEVRKKVTTKNMFICFIVFSFYYCKLPVLDVF